jgi:sugar lactone lactonase YvrE
VAPSSAGRYAVATRSGICEMRLPAGTLDQLVPLPSGDRMNDAKADPAGRLVGGTLTAEALPGVSGLYRFEPDGQVEVLISGATVSNGLGWSPDATRFYFIDSPTRQVDVFDYEIADGSISGRRRFADISQFSGIPDGLCVDVEGHVWVAVLRAGLVLRFADDGRLINRLVFPVSRVTSCAFGGSNFTDLYVTSARADSLGATSTDDARLGGSLFVVPTNTRGFAATPCRTPRPSDP